MGYYHGQGQTAGLTAAQAESFAREAEEQRAEERKRERAAKLTGAHTTMPIKDKRMVGRWMEIAREHDEKHKRGGGVSWYMMLLIGFNTGLRIGDMCKLRVADVRNRERVRIIAEKTGKMTDIKLQVPVRRAIDEATRGRDGDEWLLVSRQCDRKTGEVKPISRQRCYGIMKEIAREAGFQEHVGCHTMRKTFAWDFYQTGGDMAKLQKVLNHSSQEATIHYLGLDQQAVDETMDRKTAFV